MSRGKTRGVWFQVEPNTKLFPAVFVQPSNQNMVQLELGKLKVRHCSCSTRLSRHSITQTTERRSDAYFIRYDLK